MQDGVSIWGVGVAEDSRSAEDHLADIDSGAAAADDAPAPLPDVRLLLFEPGEPSPCFSEAYRDPPPPFGGGRAHLRIITSRACTQRDSGLPVQPHGLMYRRARLAFSAATAEHCSVQRVESCPGRLV